jgi:hypothetical protein
VGILHAGRMDITSGAIWAALLVVAHSVGVGASVRHARRYYHVCGKSGRPYLHWSASEGSGRADSLSASYCPPKRHQCPALGSLGLGCVVPSSLPASHAQEQEGEGSRQTMTWVDDLRFAEQSGLCVEVTLQSGQQYGPTGVHSVDEEN